MNQEDIQNALEAISKGGINVAGDLVLNKEVEYEVNNVEAGGIGIQIVNGQETSKKGGNAKVSNEQISQAISAINGSDKVLRHQQAFLGVCCCLISKHKWPSKMDLTVNRIKELPNANSWEIPCKWESIRKFIRYKFVMTDYSEWEDFEPNGTERDLFVECRDVARAFDEQLQKIAQI
ncbi:MAG: hypothetical protein K6C10_06325 [Prevotella sp.]|nr:hypothetical protein [Prevotella sp.]